MSDRSPHDYSERLGLEPTMNDTMSDYRKWQLEQRVRRDGKQSVPPEPPLRRSFGPEDLQHGQQAIFDTEDGQVLRG